MTDFFREQGDQALPYRLVKLVLLPPEREVLHARIATRFHDMLNRGLVDEVGRLRARADLHIELPSMRAVGYRQVWYHLDGRYGAGTMADKGIAATRQLAKRQITWLRGETDAHTFSPLSRGIAGNILKLLEGALIDQR